MDDIAMARAITIDDHIRADLNDPIRSIILDQIADARGLAIEAGVKLLDADPSNPDVIRKLQADVQLFKFIMGWLIRSLDDARDAYKSLPIEERQSVFDELLRPHIERPNDA